MISNIQSHNAHTSCLMLAQLLDIRDLPTDMGMNLATWASALASASALLTQIRILMSTRKNTFDFLIKVI